MKKSINCLSFLLIIISLAITSCTVSVGDNGADSETLIKLNRMDSYGLIYSNLEFIGSGLDENCGEVTVNLLKGTSSHELEIGKCEPNLITAWIPEDIESDVYKVEINFGNESFTAIEGDELITNIKLRPVILSMSSSEVVAGESFEITGLHIVNNSSSTVNDPKVWIMKSGYTNTVSDITVNSEGTKATIVIDDGIDPGEYDFLLSTDEWSNQLKLTIK